MPSKKKAEAQPRRRTTLRPERIQLTAGVSKPGSQSRPTGRRLSKADIETEMADLPN